MRWPKPVKRRLPRTDQIRSAVSPTNMGSVASNSPTTKATRYVDIGIVSANRTTFLPPSDDSERILVFDTATWFEATTSVTEKTALKSGSSQEGNARLASVASN